MSRIIDLSYHLEPATPVFPDYPPVAINILESIQSSRPAGRRALNSSQLTVGVHCGAHLDAPFHFIDDGATIDKVPLAHCIGTAVLVNLTAKENGLIEPSDLAVCEELCCRHQKLVIWTGWSQRWGDPAYFSDHPVMTQATAQLLVEWGVHLVGIDTPSVDRPPFPAHPVLLGNNVLILENLTNLAAINTPIFHLIALPLKISGRDASPVRAIAMVE